MTILSRVNKKYALTDGQGDSRIAQKRYIILHESGNQNDVNDADAILHEVQYMHNNFANAYATYFVGGGGQIYQIGEPGYVAWAALDANPYAPVQIELARTADRKTFLKDYEAYIELARYWADYYGIPPELDGTGNGVKSHQWVTNNYGGDHVDPYDYLARWGITQTQLQKDLKRGIEGGNEVNWNDFSTVRGLNVKGIAYVTNPNGAPLYNKPEPEEKSGRVLKQGTSWQVNDEKGNYFDVGGWVSRSDVAVRLNNTDGNFYGLTIVAKVDTPTFNKPNGKKLNAVLKDSQWLVISQNDDNSWFEIGADVWVPATNFNILL